MHAIRIDRSKPLAAEPHLGHNRYHPDIDPVAEIGEGEEISLETRDSMDGQIKLGMSSADLASIDKIGNEPSIQGVLVDWRWVAIESAKRFLASGIIATTQNTEGNKIFADALKDIPDRC